MNITVTGEVFRTLLSLVRHAFEYESSDDEEEFFEFLENELKEPINNIMKRIEHEHEVRSRETWKSDLFEYIVYWYDANGAGEAETGVQYRGSDRMAAMKAKHYAEEHCCGGSVDVRPLWKNESRRDRICRLEEEEEEEDPGVTVYSFEDGTEGFLSPYCNYEHYYLDRFGELHGKWTSWRSEPYNGQLDIQLAVNEMDLF